MRRISFRYDLLREGAFYARLRAVEDTTPQVHMESSGLVKMSFSGEFYPVPHDVDGNPMAVNWLGDEIQPIMIIDGAEHPLGVYIPTGQREATNIVTNIAIEAYDRGQRVLDTNSLAPVYFQHGTLYLDAVEQLLNAAGIRTVFKTQTNAVLTDDREWLAGTSYLTIINKLLGEINYRDLWFDAEGHARLEPAAVPEASQIRHTLSDRDPDTLVVPGIVRGSDFFYAPNVFLVVCANPDKSANMTAVAINDNPQSPLSVQRRGRQIVQVTQVDNIASQAELKAYAERQRNDSLITGETVNVTTGLLPGWGVSDVVALHYGEINSLCLSTAFDMDLVAGGKMRHTLEKVVYNLE